MLEHGRHWGHPRSVRLAAQDDGADETAAGVVDGAEVDGRVPPLPDVASDIR